MSTNSIHVVGNLVDDPTLRYTKAGKAVVNFRIAVTERINVNGEWQDKTNFITVVNFGGQAENIAVSVGKGDRVMVSGTLQTRTYEPESGVKQYFTEIKADEVGAALRWAVINELERSTGNGTQAVTPAGEMVEGAAF